MEKFCKDLREHAMRIDNYEKKEMTLLTDEKNKSYESQNVYDDDDDDDDDDDNNNKKYIKK